MEISPLDPRARRRRAGGKRATTAMQITSTKAVGRRILVGEEEREAKSKKRAAVRRILEGEEDREAKKKRRATICHGEEDDEDNSNPPPESIEALKAATFRYEIERALQDTLITLEYCESSPMFFDPQLLPVFQPATKSVPCASKFLLGLSSSLDGKPLARCSGFWIHWDQEKKTGIVLTTAHLILSNEPWRFRGGDYATDAKITVHLRDGNSRKGRLIYHQEHYDLAFFEVTIDGPVQLPSFNDGVESGQLVFRLGRDESANLRITRGRPGYLNPKVYERPYHMYLQDEHDDVKYDDGGPIIDLDGKVVGMVDNRRSGSFIPSSILLKCLDLWKKYDIIRRPHLGLAFSVIMLLDPVRVEKLSCMYDIDDGLIVEEVSKGSQAEELGIQRGDIIERFNGENISTTIQLENMLLSLCKSAGNGFDAKVHVLVDVYHTREHRRSTVELIVGVSDRGEVF